MDLADFRNLVTCIRSPLGIDDESTNDDLDQVDTPTEEDMPAVNRTIPHMNN